MTVTVANICSSQKFSMKTLPIKKRPQKRPHSTSCSNFCLVSAGHILPLARRFKEHKPLPEATKTPVLETNSVIPKVKKTVRFADCQAVRIRKPESAEDLFNSWYGDDHYRFFEADNRESIALYHAGADVDLKGLEQFIGGQDEMISRRMHTMKHVAVIVELYDVQRCCGEYDDEMIRRVSQRLSEEPIKRAYLLAN